ncbi:MAG: hypothetical protein F4W93_13970 [Dehalococcoidia bacterium]|nr:hypothetical protein [Dehalococcoidia bacterium]
MKRLILVASALSSIVVILFVLRRNSLLANAANLDPNRVNATAILGGITEPNASRDFRGGRLTAFLGGVSVNLRQADIIEKPAHIHVSAILGGVEIAVPQHWNVKKDIQLIAGGVDERRTLAQQRDDDAMPDNSPDLVVTGSVLLGGLLIRD